MCLLLQRTLPRQARLACRLRNPAEHLSVAIPAAGIIPVRVLTRTVRTDPTPMLLSVQVESVQASVRVLELVLAQVLVQALRSVRDPHLERPESLPAWELKVPVPQAPTPTRPPVPVRKHLPAWALALKQARVSPVVATVPAQVAPGWVACPVHQAQEPARAKASARASLVVPVAPQKTPSGFFRSPVTSRVASSATRMTRSTALAANNFKNVSYCGPQP